MTCPACGSQQPFEDGFCRDCGLEQPASRLPVKRGSETLPALWQQAAPVVARGAVLVLAGIAAEWVMRSVAKRALSLPENGRKRPKKSKAVAVQGEPEPAPPLEVIAVSETVIVRRTIVRR